ncbi:phosphate acyltransferase PlsX [Gammaproteobacteria bacterium]|nr:phosphate acyltransferase PlsX [Gammaproteobacteria bacterium]
MPVRIAIDAMGGDHGVSVTVPAALQLLERHHDLVLTLVGNEAELRAALDAASEQSRARIEVVHATEVVAMDEAPSQALRKKKDSSMRRAIDLVKDDLADAAVSAGNTGALMATAKFVLKTLPGIERPAICSALPQLNGKAYLLDLGANVECSPKMLAEFAVMGSVLANTIEGIDSPSIGLLNVGEEEMKGTEMIRDAATILKQSGLNYRGFVEGNDIYMSDIDVIVCDGFIGNVALKSSEGLAAMISHILKEEFSRSWMAKLAAAISYPVLKSLRQRVDPRYYNGASLLGLRGTVVKSHGGTDVLGFANAIEVAVDAVRENLPKRIADGVKHYLSTEQASR